jgi:hypothetical protein
VKWFGARHEVLAQVYLMVSLTANLQKNPETPSATIEMAQ